jgi:hypothetical protein
VISVAICADFGFRLSKLMGNQATAQTPQASAAPVESAGTRTGANSPLKKGKAKKK